MRYLKTLVADVAQYVWASMPLDMCAVLLVVSLGIAAVVLWRGRDS